MARIDSFLKLGREQGCSDVHFTVGLPPLIRLDGELAPIKYRELTPDEIATMVSEILDAGQRETLDHVGSIDLSYASPEAGRFRVNLCRQALGTTAVCRVIPSDVIPLDQLGVPQVIGRFAELTSGLVLVTGAAGTGKSTTLAAFTDLINRTRSGVVLTLEDPIEFIHESRNCLVIQREVGTHVSSFQEGLRSAVRQDPDVILVGELRDHEAMALALEASETGHLVLGTLHTRGAAQTIDRILDAFPAESHAQVRNTLAENLKCVISQELVRSSDSRGRRAAVEILVVMPAVAQLIRDGQTFKIPGVIATGRRHGMQLMDASLLALVRAGDVDAEEAYELATDKREFQAYVSRPEASSVKTAEFIEPGVGEA